MYLRGVVIFLRCGHIIMHVLRYMYMYDCICTCTHQPSLVLIHVNGCCSLICTCINNVVYYQSSSSFIHPSPDFPIIIILILYKHPPPPIPSTICRMATHTKQRTRNTNYNGDTPLLVNRCLSPLLSCHPSAKMGMAVEGGARV